MRGGPVGTTVETTPHLHLEGGHLVDFSTDPGGRTFATSAVDVGVSVNGVQVRQGSREVRARYDTNTIDSVGRSVLANGVGLIVTPAFNVQAGVHFEVELELNTQASLIAYFSNHSGLYAAANTDFSDTLSFPPTGPAFTLPVGYTANSAEAGIIDDTFVVPEPSAQSQLACGLTAMLLIRRPGQTR